MYIDWGDESGKPGDTSSFGIAGQAFEDLSKHGDRVSIADFLANRLCSITAETSASRTAVDVAANLDALKADPNVSEIDLTGGGAPRLALTSEQVANDWQAIGKIAGSYTISKQTPPNFFNNDAEADILWRNANGNVELWNSNGSGGYTSAIFGDREPPTGRSPGPATQMVPERPASYGATPMGASTLEPEWLGRLQLGDYGSSNTDWQIAGTGDFNGDGQDGVLWRNANGNVELWSPNGSGGFTYDNLGAVNTSWQIAGTGDFNGDGQDGILAQRLDWGGRALEPERLGWLHLR